MYKVQTPDTTTYERLLIPIKTLQIIITADGV